MAGITLAQAQTLLDAAITAYQAALTSQEYSHGNRRQVRAQLSALSADVEKWSRLVQKLDRGGIRITGATPT
jgi:hypothetical protein